MMWLTSIQRQIVRELRHGPLDLYALAQELREAPFRVRAELRSLRRDRLVTDQLRVSGPDSGHLWELTDRGQRCAWDDRQERLI